MAPPPAVEPPGAEVELVDDLPRFVLPADGAPAIRLERPRSPLRQMYETAGQLGAPDLRGGTFRVDHLYGPHGLKYPILALLVRRHLGPVRHALSQRTVAGGLKVVFAPGDRPATSDSPGGVSAESSSSSSNASPTRPAPGSRPGHPQSTSSPR